MPWAPGRSGNPRGRAPGSGKIDKLRAALSKELPEVLETLVAQAKAGDTGAIKLILERTVPALGPVDAPAVLNLPPVRGTDYTLQASLFVTVSGTARLGSGFLTEVAGYGPVFLLAGSLTVLALLPVLAYFRIRENP